MAVAEPPGIAAIAAVLPACCPCRWSLLAHLWGDCSIELKCLSRSGHSAGSRSAYPDQRCLPGGSTGEPLPDPSPDPTRAARFTTLFEAHYPRILGYARRRASADAAADVVAETFTIAWRRLDALPEDEQTLYWLYATARRVLANQRRAERRRDNLTKALENEPTATPAAAPGVEPSQVATALARLREEERELLLLVAWEGLDAAAIAGILRCSQNAARIRIHRARRRFGRALASLDAEMKRQGTGGHVTAEDRPSSRFELEETS
jgi:RNA polymerase sigma-70 factor (ECF subfamily)